MTRDHQNRTRAKCCLVGTVLLAVATVGVAGAVQVGPLVTNASASSPTCGNVSTSIVNSSKKALSALPASIKSLYAGYPLTITTSAYAHFHAAYAKKPWVIGFSRFFADNGYQAAMLQQVQADAAANGRPASSRS